MHKIPKTTVRHSKKAALLLSSLFAAGLSAQTTPDTKPADDSIIELSPFAVTTEKDTGYKASNSIGGTRSNTAIKDIALNIQVFTKDLADDLVMADQTQLERYNAALVNGGADAQSDNVIQQAYNSFLFRGFVQNWGMRDGVREYDPVDAAGIARVEVVKGPAAALYGLSYAGGIMNTITKHVDMTKDFVATRFTLTDQGTKRATVDANFHGKVGIAKAGVRYNGAGAVTRDKRDHSAGKTRYNQINFELQPYEGTQIQLLVENEWRQKPNGLGYYAVTSDDVATGKFNGKYNVVGKGAQAPLQVLHPEIPWTWNWANGSNPRALETSMYRLTVSQAVGENLHLTAYVQNNQRQQPDSQGWDDGGNSQNGAGWDVDGKTGWMTNAAGDEVIRRAYHWRNWHDQDHAQGVTGVYKLETGPIKNTITSGWAHWEENFVSNKFAQPANSSQFWDLPVKANIDTSAAPEPNDYHLLSPGGGREHNQNSYYFGSWQMSALENRLKLNVAMNHTQITNIRWADSSFTKNHDEPKVSVSKNSPMFGGMYDITKEVSVFAVHSTSLFPTTDKNDELTVQMPAEVGKSDEVGVKIELFNGKVSGTASYYKIKKVGGGVRDSQADNHNKLQWDAWRAQDGWTTIDANGWTHDRDSIRSGSSWDVGSLGNIVPAELESKGFEADIVVQPIKTLQFVLSYAHNTEESTVGSTKGQSNGGHVKDQMAGLVKYTFDDGVLKGLFIGSGFQMAAKSVADYQVDPSSGATICRYNPGTFYLELFAGYKFKALGFNQSIQVNAKNLTEQDDYFGWKNAASNNAVSTERYRVPTYALFSLTYGMDF